MLKAAKALGTLLLLCFAASGIQAQDLGATLAAAQRPAEDAPMDAARKPVEVMQFLGVKPGMTALEVLAGAGYTTEILAHAVGAQGKVIAHNNGSFLKFEGQKFYTRLSNNRLPQVLPVAMEVKDIQYPENTFDVIYLSNVWHDLYYATEPDWPAVDRAAVLRNLHKSLKKGGIIGIADHAASAGAGDVSQTLHRIDEKTVIDEFRAAGFVLDGESNIYRNPEDKRTAAVFDPSVSGRSDRFLLRFRKP